jgi:putative intracellular protease/amidase
MRPVYLLLTAGFADWEASLAAAEINKSSGYRVQTVTMEGARVTSMGGLDVLPDLAASEMRLQDAALVIVPGGTTWEDVPHPEVVSLLQGVASAGVPIGALCGATIALARAGLLDDRDHTSNHRGYLGSFVEAYGGESRYVEAPAVQDGNVITASGMGSVEFAHEVIGLLGLYPAEMQRIWLRIHKEKAVPEEVL